MKKLMKLCMLCLSIFTLSCEKNPAAYTLPNETVNAPVLTSAKVQTVKVNGKWRLYKDGQVYYVRGAAANQFYDKIDDYGGNTFRTYSTNDSTQKTLDLAKANGLSVMMGIWVNRERDGFNYNDPVAVKAQLDRIKEEVMRFKDHPAVLIWCIGNEAESMYTNLKLWDAVGEIAKMIHEIDPNHPTSVALAGVDPVRIKDMMQRAPDVDILSINTYAPQMPTNLGNIQAAGWTKPYMVSEYGPRGAQSMAPEPTRVLPWGGIVEQTSTEKAVIYQQVYKDWIYGNVNNGCIGSYVFVWGYQMHGDVVNWYGTHDRKGRTNATVDALQFSWTGQYPSNRAPVITSRNDMLMNGKRPEDIVKVKKSSKNIATVTASDPDGDPLTYEWVVMLEGTSAADGGFPPGIPGLIETQNSKNINFTAPASPGEYRLYVFVYDNHNKVASACVPFLVE
ncbi:glycoside hydrolase family 2 TIM barrel-domain containing protein [Pedobacter planticolens]|nr:glycoside hydrolase family 2 TIM barrel-domain containing protein [Pedobacter planticolens]